MPKILLVHTGGTLMKAAEAIKREGATEVYACCTHPVLSGKAVENLDASCIKELIVTDTIQLTETAAVSKKIKVLSVAKLLAEAIKRIHAADSVSSLFV